MIFNAAGAVLAVVLALQGQEWIMANPRAAALLTAAGAVANMILRYLTSLPISGTSNDPAIIEPPRP